MEIKMNKEIRDYAETMFFGLSLRQFLFSALGCLLSVGIFFLFRSDLVLQILSYVAQTERDFMKQRQAEGKQHGFRAADRQIPVHERFSFCLKLAGKLYARARRETRQNWHGAENVV